MPVVPVTLHLPAAPWRAVQSLAPHEGYTNTVILRAVEGYVTAAAKNQADRSGKYCDLVQALRTPVADLHLSARPAATLKKLKTVYVYELVEKAPIDLFKLPNVGEKSLREVKAKLATLGLTWDMPLEDDAYRVAVVATMAATFQAAIR